MKDYIIRHKKIFAGFLILCFICGMMRYVVFPFIVFPMRYKSQVLQSASDYDIDPFLIFSIMKAESKFNPNAISNRGAKGLMQIMDKTGKWAAEELRIKNFTPDELFNPTVNIEIGCWYVARLLRQYDGDIPTVLAAYNAGTGNIYRWRKNKSYSLDGVIIDHIPFKETRQYVKKVSRNLKAYQYLYSTTK